MVDETFDKWLHSGSFLNVATVKEHLETPFVITTKPRFEFSEKYKYDQCLFDGEFNAEEKTWNCNKTNARAVADKLGEDPTQWIGAKVYFQIEKKTIKGQLTDTLGIRKIESGSSLTESTPTDKLVK